MVSESFGGRSLPQPTLPLSMSSPMEGTYDEAEDSSKVKKPSLLSAIQKMRKFFGQGEWKEKLLKASNFASLLCVVDCTVLPFVTVVLPLFGIVAGTPAQMEYLHELGHKVALFFVMPVGGTATTMNYVYSHRKKRIATIGATGLLMILLANSGGSCGHHHHHHHVTSAAGRIMHAIQHGAIHRIVNISGCALLLGSNYLSRREGCGCDHDHESGHHNHSHDHDHHHGE